MPSVTFGMMLYEHERKKWLGAGHTSHIACRILLAYCFFNNDKIYCARSTK